MSQHHEKMYDFTIDTEPCYWPHPIITGKEVRDKATIPANVHLFVKIPGHPDELVVDAREFDLSKGRQDFCTDAVGSKGG